MLLEFSVENFLSICELQTMQLRAAPIKSADLTLESNTIAISEKTEVLKTKAIYGANASGKSNLIRAMVAMLLIIKDSIKDEKTFMSLVHPYVLSRTSLSKPSFFEMVFIIDSVQYRYGFEADQKKVHSEWLFSRPLNSTTPVKERYFFVREDMELKVNEERYPEGKRIKPAAKEPPLFRPNSLVLPTLAAFNSSLANKLMRYFRSGFTVLSGMDDDLGIDHAIKLVTSGDKDFKRSITDLLRAIDPTIKAVEPVELEMELPYAQQPHRVDTKEENLNHVAIVRERIDPSQASGENVLFLLGFSEAEGTKRIFGLGGYIFKHLKEGGTLMIDEFDARMHPNLTRKIVELFHDPDSNPKGAQLIFVTHDSNLMDPKLMRRDQIAFAAKDAQGATEFYSLAEIKGVRNNASFEKDYLAGRYQAIPTHLNQMEVVIQDYLAHEAH